LGLVCSLKELELIIDCYQIKPSNQYAMRIIDQLEQMQAKHEVEEILHKIKQHIAFMRRFDTAYL